MSQSDASISPDSSSTIEIAHKCSNTVPSESLVTAAYSYVTSVNEPQPQHQSSLLSQQVPTLPEHNEPKPYTANTDNDVITVLHESRRGSFVCSLQSACREERPKLNRNPVMPQRTDNTTPPSMAEIVRRMTGDTSSTRRSSLAQSDAVLSRQSTRQSPIAGTEINGLTRTDRDISIGGLARSVTKRMPTIRPDHLPAEKALQGVPIQNTDGPEGTTPVQSNKKSRKLSLQMPASLKKKTLPVISSIPSSFAEEPSTCQIPNKVLPGPSSRNSGLAARRQVKLDLTLPVGLPDLSRANAYQDTRTGILSSITASRPRSPKTPLTREKGVTWISDTSHVLPGAASVVKNSSISADSVEADTKDDVVTTVRFGSPLSPDTLQTLDIEVTSVLPPNPVPNFVSTSDLPSQRVIDRYHVSHSGCQSNANQWLTNNSAFGNASDSLRASKAAVELTDQEACLQKELFQLANTSKAARARRWPWNKSKASGSEEQARTEDERIEDSKGTSVNIFKRSHRFPDARDKEKKEKKSSNPMGPLWRREKPPDKPPLPSASLANMLVPPTFVPPGCEKVLMTPAFDASHDVRGKLADFFFDINGSSSIKRKPRTSLRGYWDSNAVLMSMRTDLSLTKDKNEEGPDGQPPPAAFHFGPVNDTPGHDAAPGLYTAPDGYLRVKGDPSSPSRHSVVTPTQDKQDSWFRMHHGDYAADDELLTAAALKEADERRKFEWLVPEHLPNSPLCPLHPKYVGPSKGLCYWHGKKSNGWGVEPRRDYIAHPMKIGHRRTRGWEVGKIEGPKAQEKKTRWQDLVDPV